MGLTLMINSSASSLPLLSSLRKHSPIPYPPKPANRSAFTRSRIALASLASPGSIPSPATEPISATATNENSPNGPSPIVATNPNATPLGRFVQSAESTVERVIFDFRFLALLAVGGSLLGSVLCFLNGCVYIKEAYVVYWTACVKGIHSGQMVLKLVEAIDVYLAGTVMLIFAMGLYGLFISNVPPTVHPGVDRALKGSSLFGMFTLKERPKWMKISSLDELKTKVGHVIVMILLVKMFERSKMVTISTGMDLLSYSICIFLSSASLYILHNLHKSDE
ncbi:hypothetical protein RND81_08G229900 [Saponaria officinalis]|uniref:Structural constituent of ribosome n=1 Tax=Saponaria officinalis TaxID=3572 RepID=A0AAW1J9Y1_SAPOF